MSNKDLSSKMMHEQVGELPNYIVNLDELEDIIEESIKDTYNDKGCVRSGMQRSKGFLVESSGWGVETKTWEVPFEIEVTGITFAQEHVRNMGYDDYINIYVNDELVVETVYLKEMQEKKNFRTMKNLQEGDIIKIEYINGTGIKKEFKIDIEYLNKTPMSMQPIDPPPIEPDPEPIPPKPEPEEPPIEPELVPIYRVYLRYEGAVATDLDIYANLFNNEDGSDISPSRTVGFSRRGWTLDSSNMISVARVSDNHLGENDREDEPEIIEIYGQPAQFFRFYAVNYRYGDRLEEKVTMEIFKVDEYGNDAYSLGYIVKESQLFHEDKARVYFFDFEIETESVVEL